MNPFVFSCIAPHGGEIIPELAGEKPERMNITRQSMLRLGNWMKEAEPGCLIVLTPHGTRIDGQFSITGSETVEGIVEENGEKFSMKRKIHREMADLLARGAKAEGLPAGVIGFGTSAGPLSCLQLDWGAAVPLRFMPDIPVVIITPSRSISYEMHIEFGRMMRKVVAASGIRTGLIASCDWSHTHNPAGPYGYHEEAQILDEKVTLLLQQDNLEEMAEFPEESIENAKPDGIWQTMILAGAIPFDERKSKFLSYEAPTYFGLLCMAYHQ
ncbi:extradiol ring-cleavage dioxygenase [Bacillus salacetis]|uniref:Extradiol ring-cleavage dioxygenase n=2 Tax=Bacillus salacetis TaxID=2315464 RepID=A0A3A1R0E2_9BACI|nr:extradiol ring-cleavage dioxygenase [Bacillus salacetis]